MRRSLTDGSRGAKQRTARLRWFGLLCAGAIALAGYGLTGAPAFGTSASKSAPKVTVKVKKISGVGIVLVDANGRTLYTLTNGGQAVACTGTCASVWPPLTVAAGSKPKGAKGVTKLGVTAGQVTAAGLPLYRFSGDSQAGQANGEGINSFGGVWHVVTVAGSTTSGTKPPSGGGGGSGY